MDIKPPRVLLMDILDVQVLPEQSLLYSAFNRDLNHEEFKAALLYVVDQFQEHSTLYWLLDSSRNNFTLQDQGWVIKELSLLINQTTIRKAALVHNGNVFESLVADIMRDRIYHSHGPVQELEHFSSIPAALDWLLPGIPQDFFKFISPADKL
ncbi:hypothetical protein [Pontibacter burrus]|uniref:STAS/SEC14 domain-containing protein n=1 Tax=Pontibacter burrus TaxID=2704466 RepID=A0A6B3LW19_9BACT|nr:hypothetical protein [Pontibacter burrus]NEM97644.1 hypothetical protein [Pontibacter burrus]